MKKSELPLEQTINRIGVLIMILIVLSSTLITCSNSKKQSYTGIASNTSESVIQTTVLKTGSGNIGVGIDVYIIDSCEYVVVHNYSTGVAVIHKENCSNSIHQTK